MAEGTGKRGCLKTAAWAVAPSRCGSGSAVVVEVDEASVRISEKDRRELADHSGIPEGAPRLTLTIGAGLLGEVRVDR